MKAIWSHRRSFLVSILLLPLLSGCPAKESDAESINLELMFLLTFLSAPAECNGSASVESLPLNQTRSIAADGNRYFRILRSSALVTTTVQITINDASCDNYSRTIGYCDWINRIVHDAYVTCDSGKGALGHQVSGTNGPVETCTVTYPRNDFIVGLFPYGCAVTIIAQE